jgi:hypothetical protein
MQSTMAEISGLGVKYWAEHPARFTELAQRLPVVLLEAHTLDRGIREVSPAVAFRDGLLITRERGPLVGHLQKEKERQLFEVVLVGKTVVAKDVAIGPELLDDAVGEVAHGADPTSAGGGASVLQWTRRVQKNILTTEKNLARTVSATPRGGRSRPFGHPSGASRTSQTNRAGEA